jgi:hypothetical protein
MNKPLRRFLSRGHKFFFFPSSLGISERKKLIQIPKLCNQSTSWKIREEKKKRGEGGGIGGWKFKPYHLIEKIELR